MPHTLAALMCACAHLLYSSRLAISGVSIARKHEASDSRLQMKNTGKLDSHRFGESTQKRSSLDQPYFHHPKALFTFTRTCAGLRWNCAPTEPHPSLFQLNLRDTVMAPIMVDRRRSRSRSPVRGRKLDTFELLHASLMVESLNGHEASRVVLFSPLPSCRCLNALGHESPNTKPRSPQIRIDASDFTKVHMGRSLLGDLGYWPRRRRWREGREGAFVLALGGGSDMPILLHCCVLTDIMIMGLLCLPRHLPITFTVVGCCGVVAGACAAAATTVPLLSATNRDEKGIQQRRDLMRADCSDARLAWKRASA